MNFNGIHSFKKWACLSIASMGLVACGGGSADGKTAAASGANNQAAASSESNTGKDDQTINFGIINTESSQNLKTDWDVNAHVKLHQEIRVWAPKSAPP